MVAHDRFGRPRVWSASARRPGRCGRACRRSLMVCTAGGRGGLKALVVLTPYDGSARLGLLGAGVAVAAMVVGPFYSCARSYPWGACRG